MAGANQTVPTASAGTTPEPTVTLDQQTQTLAAIPLDCSPSDVGADSDGLIVLGCSDGWALTQVYESCNGAPCVASDLWAVWSPRDDDDMYLGYDSYPYGYCRDHVRSEGAPEWLLATVPWTDCAGEVAPLEYRNEPDAGPLALGDVGPRVAMLQQWLGDGEFSVGGVDGRFGRQTARAVRQLQFNFDRHLTGTTDNLADTFAQQDVCLGTIDGIRIGVDGVDGTSPLCAVAIERWPITLAADDQITTVDFGDGWTCSVTKGRDDWAPAAVGSCAVDGPNVDRPLQLRVFQVPL